MIESQNLQTLPALARRFRVTQRQIEYAAARYQIEPAARVGLVRVYDCLAAERIRSALVRTGALPPLRKPREVARANS